MRVRLLLLLTLFAGTATAQGLSGLTGCKEDRSVCRDDCSIEYGSSTRTYSKLRACLQRCQKTFNLCRERHLALQERRDLGIEPEPVPAAPPSIAEEPRRYTSTEEDPSDDDAPTPLPRSESTGSSVRTGVYRASEADPEPAPAPAKAAEAPSAPKPEAVTASEPQQEPAAAAETDPLDEEPPPPRPKPKPTLAPTRPALPPEPKDDISDWDPDGD